MNLFGSLITALWGTFSWEPATTNTMATIQAQHQGKLQMDTQSIKDGVVVIGGGIIGLSTAYSLALSLQEMAQDFTPNQRSRLPKITVVESSERLCPAASSQATGGLGDFGFGENKTGVAGVSSLSYKIHVELAEKYNGRGRYGFGRQDVYRLTPKGFTGTPSPGDDWGADNPPVSVPLTALPRWVRTSDDWEVQRLSSGPRGAHIDPKDFCAFLIERVKELGVNIETNANVTSVEYDHARKSFSSVQLQSSCGAQRSVPCRTLVLAAGPWSDRVYNRLFPDALVKLPMNSTERAGNHIRIKIPGWKEGDTEESVQVYYTNVTPNGSRFDVTSFTNGDLYIGGWGAIPEEIPELASSVHAQPSEIKDMLEFVKKYVKVDTRHELEYYDAGRCYRPTAIPKRPIITKVDWDLLGHERHSDTSSASISQERHVTVGGLIINTAHGSDGITLGPGSGRLASELVLGLTPSVDISSLGIPESSHL